ncbi:hypothetical protein SAMN04488074_1011010 [Lentzea albidocapillata subsp. violacea]|uniref:Uncharacterized protein n=1 Tax=Lentzea albidocapillata subsp. violacea TaxID=128104 RepID=A0A1G8SKE0_9PSEU|nr:hypothetical protein [Lentzea albidocapillata]SDJ29709.1 hypothetical protein SAMN04488074_1011010 [Lentzea albidocapillata subsp. violacea]
MKRLVSVTLSALAATALLASAGPPAHAAAGRAVVFSTELTPVKIFTNPNGCNKLPVDAHVLVNLTNTDVFVHADPFCLTPGLVVKEDHGSHVALGSGSFSVKD